MCYLLNVRILRRTYDPCSVTVLPFKVACISGLGGAFSIFCPFAFKARSTTLIFVVCITFHQTSILDDMHQVLTVFTGNKLCFLYVFECTPHILKYTRSGLTLTLKIPA